MTTVVPFLLSMKKISVENPMKVLSHRQHILRVNELKIGNRVRFMITEKDIPNVLFSKIFTPEIVPEWTHDRGGIWNNVQETEFRKDAQYAVHLM